MYPPLAGSIGSYVAVPQGRRYLIEVVLTGMTGPIDVNGTTYNGLMPSAADLSDAEVASVLNQALTEFNSAELPKDFAPIAASEVKQGRTAHLQASDLPGMRASLIDALKKTTTSNRAAR
jgi:hypothetical protein